MIGPFSAEIDMILPPGSIVDCGYSISSTCDVLMFVRASIVLSCGSKNSGISANVWNVI